MLAFLAYANRLLALAKKLYKMKHLCAIDGCGRPRMGRHRFCGPHYGRKQRYGDPLGGGTYEGEPETFLRSLAAEPHLACDECVTWPFKRF